MDSSDVGSSSQPARIGGRFRVDAELGRGGMAVVYRAHDEAADRTVALKYLCCDDERYRERVMRLFQREYLVLSELAHPRIVRAFEYGVHDGTPYYTMELLEGSDLKGLGRIPWRQACSFVRDIASALAMVHSRRLVHRDVTPRNVRRTGDGRVKLIDFGAASSMGEESLLVGTPAYVAPEVVLRQPIDGRSDLYSLGAFAYRLLTGAHAYPARRFADLRALWRAKPTPAAQLAEVPSALDELVTSLLSHEPLGRPENAWEVIERLTSIAELPRDEESGTARAYLTTPTLVGREREREAFRRRLSDAREGRGSVTWVRGLAGSGRSRLLASFVLEARLLDIPVVHASAARTSGEDFSLMGALVRDWTGQVSIDDPSVPEDVQAVLRDAGAAVARDARAAATVGGRRVLLRWLQSVARERGILVAVDDVHEADAASAAVLGELVQSAAEHRMVAVVTLGDTQEGLAGAWSTTLRQVGPALEPGPLAESETETLVRSIFGDAAHVKPLAHLLHRLSSGIPGTCMSLAQSLVDRGLVKYEQGRWVLPEDPHALGLSDSVVETFVARLQNLGPEARALAGALSLVDPLVPIAEELYPALLEPELQERWFVAVFELRSSDILRRRGEGYAFSHPAWTQAARASMDAGTQRRLHLRLADLYANAADRDLFMTAWHLQQGGEHGRAVDLLVDYARASNATVAAGPAAMPRSAGVYRLARSAFEAALQHGEQEGRSPRDLFELRRGLVYLAVYFDPSLLQYAGPVIEQLRDDSGLVHWARLDGVEDPRARIIECLAAAQAAHAERPEAHCLEPGEAVRALAQLVSTLAGAHARMLDPKGLETLPALIDPFRSLAPALDLIGETVRCCLDASMGLDAVTRCTEVIARIENDPESRQHEVMMAIVHALRYYVGVWQARYGGVQGLARADEVERDLAEWETRFPYHAGLGRYRSWHVRRLTHLYNGDVEQARICQEHIELLQLDGLDPLVAPNMQTGVYMEARAHALAGALLELREAVDTIAGLASNIPSWVPVLHWARGEYHRVAGDPRAARAELERALALLPPARHVVWAWAVTSLADAMLQEGHAKEALKLAEAALERCAQVDVQPLTLAELERVVALARAQLGDAAGAGRQLEASIATRAHDMGGVPLGRLYEARAQIALLEEDADAFASYAQMTERLFRPGRHPALVARCEKLRESGQRQEGDSRATVELSGDRGKTAQERD